MALLGCGPVSISAGLGQLDLGQAPECGHPQRHQPDLLLGLPVGVELLIALVEAGGPFGDARAVAPIEVRNRDVHLVDLVEVSHVGRANDLDVRVAHALRLELCPSLGLKLVQYRLYGLEIDAVEARRVGAGEVVLEVCRQHPKGGEHGSRVWNVDALDPQHAGDGGRVKSRGASEGHQGELAWVHAPFDGRQPYAFGDVGRHELVHSEGGLDGREA